jgi:hypothetical protein
VLWRGVRNNTSEDILLYSTTYLFMDTHTIPFPPHAVISCLAESRIDDIGDEESLLILSILSLNFPPNSSFADTEGALKSIPPFTTG